MTYLQLVNNILKRLREREVSTVTENEYSSLISVLVNDAKQDVENAWDWSHLRSNIPVVTVAGTDTYTLTNSGDRFKVMDVMDETNQAELKYRDSASIRRSLAQGNTTQDVPMFYTFETVDGNDDTTIKVFPIPDDVYTLGVYGVSRQDDLSADGDVLSVPYQPVLLLAWAKAIEERGEDAGVMSSSAYITAQRSLADAISFDAARQAEETIWTVA